MATIAKLPALIFDFDGTLADSLHISLDILYQLVHHKPLPAENVSVLRGMTLIQMLRRLRISPLRALLLRRRVYHAMAQRLDELNLVPGVDDMIRSLAVAYTVYIVSANDTTNVQKALKHFGLDPYIREVVGGASLLDKSWALRRLIWRQQLFPETTWYIGDQANDVRAAHRVGMHAAAVSWGFSNIHVLEKAHPDILAFTPEELVKHFTRVRP